jgi:hypothetical protein
MPTLPRVDSLLSTLNATDVGTLESIAEKLREVHDELVSMAQPDLAIRVLATLDALKRGDVAEFRRGRAFLQSKIGHLRS